MIYAIRCVGGPVKFGFAKNPKNRLASLQTAHHQELYLLAEQKTSNDLKVESLIHEHCRSLHVRGEWFKAEGEAMKIAAYISKGRVEEYLASIVKPQKQNKYPRVEHKAFAVIRHFLKKHVGYSCSIPNG